MRFGPKGKVNSIEHDQMSDAWLHMRGGGKVINSLARLQH